MGGFLQVRRKGRQAFVAHQHQEALLGKIGGRGRIEPGRPILDGVCAVERHRLARRERGLVEGLAATGL